jgi:glycosyltransferase involved in cell wall biosynthesis
MERKATSVKVVHLTASAERRGAEIFASDLVKALDPLGIEQSVAVLHGGARAQVRFEAETIFLNRDRVRPRFDRATLAALRDLLSSSGPALVQAHGGEALKYAIPASLGTGTRVVYRRIGSTSEDRVGYIRRSLHGTLIRRADRIIAVSHAVAASMVDTFGVPGGDVVVIPNGVDPERVAAQRSRDDMRRSLGVPADAPLLLAVGALHWEKDPIGHLSVAQRVLADVEDARFAMAGDGPMSEQVRAALDRMPCRDRMMLLGSRDDVADLLGAADVLLLASRREGMPAVAIEAGMAGVPVAGFALAGVPEVVQDGRSGILSPPGDVAHLAGRITELLRDPSRRARMADAARSWCRPNFDIGVVAPQYADVYDSIIGERRVG